MLKLGLGGWIPSAPPPLFIRTSLHMCLVDLKNVIVFFDDIMTSGSSFVVSWSS